KSSRFEKIYNSVTEKVKELNILSNVRACLIITSPNDAKPVVWPSLETTHGLLDQFYALPKFMQHKYAMSVESYLEERINKIQEKLAANNNEKKKYAINEMMAQLQDGSISIADPSWSDQRYDFRLIKNTRNDVFVGDRQDDERDEATRRADISASSENGSNYLTDKLGFPPKPEIYQQIRSENHHFEMDPTFPQMMTFNGLLGPVSQHSQNQNMTSNLIMVMIPPRQYPYQGSSSNGNHHLEMDPVFPQMMSSNGLHGSVSQPSQNHYMNNNPINHNINNSQIMDMNPPRQYPFHIMNHEVGVNEGGYNICNSQFYGNNNIIATNDKSRQEPTPSEPTGGENHADAMPFDINNILNSKLVHVLSLAKL
ncbi:hypothetical protein CARUB_v10016121mg, partial [Capsella rubella]